MTKRHTAKREARFRLSSYIPQNIQYFYFLFPDVKLVSASAPILLKGSEFRAEVCKEGSVFDRVLGMYVCNLLSLIKKTIYHKI